MAREKITLQFAIILLITVLFFDYAASSQNVVNIVVPGGSSPSWTAQHNEYWPGTNNTHVGVDIFGADTTKGGDSVYAVFDGIVEETCDVGGTDPCSYDFLGNAIMIRHPHLGRNGADLFSIYLHLKDPTNLSKDQTVIGGVTELGKLGKTGNANGYNHVHFEIRYFGKWLFPAWGNIYCPGDCRKDGSVSENWENPQRINIKSLVTVDGNAIYWLQNDKIYHVLRPDIIDQMGQDVPEWSFAHVTTISSLNGFANNGKRFIGTDGQSDGVLVKVIDTPDIYVISGGKRERIPSPEEFNKRGYDWDDVIEVSQSIMDLFTESGGHQTYQVGEGAVAENIRQTFVDAWNAHSANLGSAIDVVKPANSSTGNSGYYQAFNNGSIQYISQGLNAGQAFCVYGDIYDKWGQMGYAGSLLGFPTNEQSSVKSSFDTPGSYQTFEKGSIQISEAGIFSVYSRFYEKWGQLGYADSPLGFPLGDQLDATSGFGTSGSYQRFEGGSVQIIGAEAYVVYGEIYSEWGRHGYAGQANPEGVNYSDGYPTWAGFPTSERYPCPAGECQDFEGGYIHSNGSSGQFVSTTHPLNLTAEIKTDGSVELNWINRISTKGLNLYRQGSPTEKIAVLSSSTNSYVDVFAENGKPYNYFISAYNNTSESPYSNVAYINQDNAINFILENGNASMWFGGDDRDEIEYRNVGVGQSFLSQKDAHLLSAGFKFYQGFDYHSNPIGQGHDVTLVMNLRLSDGTILKTVEKIVPADFRGGWVLFDLDTEIEGNNKYIFTCYLKDGESLKLSSSILGNTEDLLPNSNGYSGTINILNGNMEEWNVWKTHPWDFCFQVNGYYLKTHSNLDTGPWPMFGHDARHTRRSPYKAIDGPILKWSYKAGGNVISSPAISSDGTIYFASTDNYLYALYRNGTLKWRFQIRNGYNFGDFISSPAISSDGTIYIGSDEGVYAINPDGREKWFYTKIWDNYNMLEIGNSSPVIDDDGTVYIAVHDKTIRTGRGLLALNPDGSNKWFLGWGSYFRTPYSSPAIGNNDNIYIGSIYHYTDIVSGLQSISKDGGWIRANTIQNDIYSSPSVDENGFIYFGAMDKFLYSLYEDCSLRWKYETGSYILSSPGIGSDGTIYTGSQDGFLYAVSSEGDLRWRYHIGSYLNSSSAIDRKDSIYIGASDSFFYALNSDGTLKWSFKADNAIYSSSAIDFDGTIYFGSNDGNLYAIGLPDGKGGIYGKTIDLEQQNTLQNVILSANNREVLSNKHGFFGSALDPGVYNVTCSKTGYQSITIPNVVVTAGQVTELNVELTVPGPLNIVTTTLPSAEVGVYYNDRVRITGGTGPYTYSFDYGSLPPGLVLDTAYGNISGIPAAEGSYTFAVGVTDSLEAYAGREFNLEVTEPLTITSTSPLVRGTRSIGYFYSIQANGGTSPYNFVRTAGTLPPGINLSSTGNLSGTPTATGSYDFTIQISDASGRIDEKSFHLDVVDPLVIATGRLSDGIMGVVYNQSLTASGGYGNYFWQVYSGILPMGLSLDGASGVLSGAPSEATYGTIVLSVSDADGRITYKDFTLRVSAPLQILTNTLPAALKDTSFSEKVRTNGGIEPFTFSYQGQLPAGLTLDKDTGIISGTPTVAGFTNVNITVTDSTYPSSQATTQSLGIRTTGSLTITSTAVLPNGKIGVPANPIVLTAGSGESPYSWSMASGYLPEGITLNEYNGVLTGTPQDKGDFVFTVQVKDDNGVTATKEFFWHISGDLAIVTGAIPDGAKDESYSFTLEADGGLPLYSWRIKSGALPDGLSFNGTTGTISGRPTSQQTTREFTIEVSDSDSPAQAAEKVFIMQILDDLYVFNETLPNGRINEAYTATISAQLGKPPCSWRLESGVLPPGLSLASSPSVATLQGTPTQTGTYVFTIEVSDTGTPVKYATKEYTVKIYGDVVIANDGMKTAQGGVPYSDNIVVSGGQLPFIWKIVSGALPTGLSLNSTSGHIYGTTNLAVGQSSTFTVQVTDSGDPAGFDEKELVIYVVDPVAITTESLQGAALGFAYHKTLEGEGGLSPHRWFIHSGNLPAGITLNRDTGEISGTATGCGNYNFTIRLEDSARVPTTVTKAFTLTVIAVNDADCDGLSDSIENATCTDPNDADTDDDCIPDGVEDANHNGYIDGNETDPCDRDTDGDGIQDGTELGYTLSDVNPDTNPGIFQPDLDPSTKTNPLDDDSDNDGLLDGDEDGNHNGRVDGGETNPYDATRPNATPWIPLLLMDE